MDSIELIRCQNCGFEAMAIEGETIRDNIMCPRCGKTKVKDWQLRDQWRLTEGCLYSKEHEQGE